MKISPSTVAIIAGTFVFCFTVLAFLAYMERDYGLLAAFMVAAILPIGTTTAMMRQLGRQIEDVQTKVNGRMTQLIDKKTLSEDAQVIPIRKGEQE